MADHSLPAQPCACKPAVPMARRRRDALRCLALGLGLGLPVLATPRTLDELLHLPLEQLIEIRVIPRHAVARTLLGLPPRGAGQRWSAHAR